MANPSWRTPLGDPMLLAELILLVTLVTLDAWAIFSTWRSRRGRWAKVLWTVGVLVVPLLGAGLWLLAGPRPVSTTRASVP